MKHSPRRQLRVAPVQPRPPASILNALVLVGVVFGSVLVWVAFCLWVLLPMVDLILGPVG